MDLNQVQEFLNVEIALGLSMPTAMEIWLKTRTAALYVTRNAYQSFEDSGLYKGISISMN
ncbi:MAG: hypothetical protein M1840_008838 [Geoglossum simile]|nr:MAG: hypothetical protein M1840_008838 [Geoglossum simile]